MSRYDPRELFNKEPVAIAGALRSVLFVAVMMGAIAMDEKQLAAIAIALEVVLGLFARNAVTPVNG